MSLRLRGEIAFDDMRTFGPGRGHIAALHLGFRQHVAIANDVEHFEIASQILVDQRRVGGQCVLRRQQFRQFLVMDNDQLRGPPCGGLGFGGDGGHRFTQIAHFVDGQCHLVLDEGAHPVAQVEILAGHDGDHAGDRQRLGQVIAFDARMGIVALRDRTVQHARPVQIGSVGRAPGHPVHGVKLWLALAERAVTGHVRASANSSSTASTIFT